MPGENVEGGIPVVKVRDYDHRGIDLSSLLRTSPEIEAPYRRSRLQAGDILMAIRGTTGVLTMVPPELNGANITQDSARIRVNPVDAAYVYQALQAPIVQRQIRLHTVGQAVRGINIASVRALRIPWPDTYRRDAIATLLSKLDTHVSVIETLIKQKTEYMRGLAQRLLSGKTRLSEFAAEEWIEKPLSEFFEERSKLNSSRSVALVYSCTKTVGIVPQSERFGKRLASTDVARYKIVEGGDLVYDPMLLWDGSIGFVPDNGRGVVSPAYETFTVTGRANRDYFRVLLKSYNLVQQYKKISKGTNTRRRKADARDFLKLTVPMPPTKSEQDRIAQILVAAQHEIDLLEKQRILFGRYKRGLLGSLLAVGDAADR